MASDPNSSWGSAAPPVEGEGDTLSNAQRSTLKWEKEEALGAMATVAPVLYTNMNFPGLKDEFPGECWPGGRCRDYHFLVSVRWCCSMCLGSSPCHREPVWHHTCLPRVTTQGEAPLDRGKRLRFLSPRPWAHWPLP